MNEPDRTMMDSAISRPVVPLLPDHENAALALIALEQSRMVDAQRHIEKIPESPLINRAWKMLLQGRLKMEKSQPVEAESYLLQAAAIAFIDEMGTVDLNQSCQLRLCAMALYLAGRVLRRRDKPGVAFQTHLSAYHLREKHGSIDELWETSIELGLDMDLARTYEEARSWYEKAIQFAEQSPHDSLQKQAMAWTHMSNNLAESNQLVEAVQSARNARNAWVEHDTSDVSVARADLTLGSTLLKFAVCLHERGDDQSVVILSESLDRLNEARESLLAFGADHAADAHWCDEQIQFAQQLHTAMVT